MTLFVDTSVWSVAFRRGATSSAAEVSVLRRSLESGDTIVTTGLILQELLQGFCGPKARRDIIDRFGALPLLVPDRQDHIGAAELRNRNRRAGVRLGTIDARLAQLCIRHSLGRRPCDDLRDQVDREQQQQHACCRYGIKHSARHRCGVVF